jgi:methylmalonyl-CoA mutase cobalamin-binding domain/chain
VNQENIYRKIMDGVVVGDRDATVAGVTEALSLGMDAFGIVENALTKGMDIVGEKFASKEYFLPDMLVAASVVTEAMKILKPHLATDAGVQDLVVVMGTVEGDIHDIGKNMVIIALEASGFKTVDAGVNVSPAQFVKTVKEHNASVVGLSALITPTMVNIKPTIEAFIEAGLRDQVKIMVGGAPLTQEFAKSVGADYYGETVRDAVMIVKQIAGEGR